MACLVRHDLQETAANDSVRVAQTKDQPPTHLREPWVIRPGSPMSVGAGRLGINRRRIGRGNLARRDRRPVLQHVNTELCMTSGHAPNTRLDSEERCPLDAWSTELLSLLVDSRKIGFLTLASLRGSFHP